MILVEHRTVVYIAGIVSKNEVKGTEENINLDIDQLEQHHRKLKKILVPTSKFDGNWQSVNLLRQRDVRGSGYRFFDSRGD